MKTINFAYPISLPSLPSLSSLKKQFGTYFQFAGDETSSDFVSERSRVNVRSAKRFLRKSPFIPVGIIVLVLILIVTILFRAVGRSNSNTSVLSVSNTGKAMVEKAKATQKINKDFTFALKDDTGKEVSKLKYIIEDGALQDEIIVKGERARAIEGRTFLIINLKITNDFNKSVSINSRDYIRLTVNKSTEKLAPDIHNDPVEVQAISTKYTRVGFPINETDHDLTLQVGELNGPKESIKLKLN